MTRKKTDDPQVIPLQDLEGRQFWAGIILVIGLTLVMVGVALQRQAMRRSLDQVDELSERVERLTDHSSSEPPKT